MNIISTDNFEFRKLTVPTTKLTQKKKVEKNALCYYYRFSDIKWHKCDIKLIEKIAEPTVIIIFSELAVLQKTEYLSNILTKALKKDLQFLDKDIEVMLIQFQACIEQCVQIIHESQRILEEPIETPVISCYIFTESDLYLLQKEQAQNYLQRNENDLFLINTNKGTDSNFYSTNIRFFQGDSIYLKSQHNNLQLFRTNLVYGNELLDKPIKKEFALNINWLAACIGIITLLAWLAVFYDGQNQISNSTQLTEETSKIDAEQQKMKVPRIDYNVPEYRTKKTINSQANDLVPIESEKQQILQKRSELLNDSTAKEELDALTEQYIKLEKKQKRLER